MSTRWRIDKTLVLKVGAAVWARLVSNVVEGVHLKDSRKNRQPSDAGVEYSYGKILDIRCVAVSRYSEKS